MADYITKIRTAEGDKQIDYNALANLPDISALASGASKGNLNLGATTVYSIKNESYTSEDGKHTWEYQATITDANGSSVYPIKPGMCFIYEYGYSFKIFRVDYKISKPDDFEAIWAITFIKGTPSVTNDDFTAVVISPMYRINGQVQGFIDTAGTKQVSLHFSLLINNFEKCVYKTGKYKSLEEIADLFLIKEEYDVIDEHLPIRGKLYNGSKVKFVYSIASTDTPMILLSCFDSGDYYDCNEFVANGTTQSIKLHTYTIIPGIGEFYV